MAQPFGAADRNRELHYCSTARCRCECLTHDFPPLIGGHGLYCGSDVLSERIVDKRLVSHPGSSRFGLECRHANEIRRSRSSRSVQATTNNTPFALMPMVVQRASPSDDSSSTVRLQ